MIWLAVIVVNQNDLVGCYISVSVRSRKHWPIISYICYLSTQANMPMVMLMCFLLLIAALRARSMYFEDDVISSESGSQDPNGATEELASQSSSCDQPIGSGSTPRCNLFEDDFAGSSEASDQESTRTRDDSHNESEGGHSGLRHEYRWVACCMRGLMRSVSHNNNHGCCCARQISPIT
jgi:hypothetical protein